MRVNFSKEFSKALDRLSGKIYNARCLVLHETALGGKR